MHYSYTHINSLLDLRNIYWNIYTLARPTDIPQGRDVLFGNGG